MSREKTSNIIFRVSDEERSLVNQKKELANIKNLSGYIRKMCIDGLIINLNIPELDEIKKLLRITSNNVNQIARRINSGGEAYCEDIAEVGRQLEEIRMAFGKVLIRPSQTLCKPPSWCIIEAARWRFRKWEEKHGVQRKMPVGQKSGSCCKRAISAAWRISRICLKKQSRNSWKTVWKQNLRTNWVKIGRAHV